MSEQAPRRYKTDGNGDTRPAFYGKLTEEFNARDMPAFAADTDPLLFQKVSEETLAAIHAAGYDYQVGAVIPRPGGNRYERIGNSNPDVGGNKGSAALKAGLPSIGLSMLHAGERLDGLFLPLFP